MTDMTGAPPETKSADSGEVAEAFDDFMRAFDAFKQTNDERLGQIERKLSADVVTTEKLGRIDRALDENKRLVDELVLKNRRPQLGDTGLPRSAAAIEHKAAFESYVRGGQEEGLRRVEQKALVISGGDGGYLVPEETEREIGRRLAIASPIRGIASVRQMSANVYKKPFATTGAATG
jgi:HK97 family phage major capsid protein